MVRGKRNGCVSVGEPDGAPFFNVSPAGPDRPPGLPARRRAPLTCMFMNEIGIIMRISARGWGACRPG